MISPVAMREDQDAAPSASKRVFIRETDRPAAAMTWRTAGEKAKALQSWRIATGRTFPEAARVLRVAWALEWLFGREGFAYATDGYLEKELIIPIKKIQAALQDLERAGSIIRASVMVRGRAQRRIWPSSVIVDRIFPATGNMDTPHGGSKPFPIVGGQNTLRKQTSFRVRNSRSLLDTVRLDAEIRERRLAARSSAPSPSDDVND